MYGQKGFPPALEAGVGSEILNTENITLKGGAGLQLSLSWPTDSLPLRRVWFEEARLEALKATLICKELR